MDTPIYDAVRWVIDPAFWEYFGWVGHGFFAPPCAADEESEDAPCGSDAWDRLREHWYDLPMPEYEPSAITG